MTPATSAPSANPCVPSAVAMGEIDIERIEGTISGSLTAKVRKLIDDHPERALEVVRAWMAEDYPH